jgi:hypothetical protein
MFAHARRRLAALLIAIPSVAFPQSGTATRPTFIPLAEGVHASVSGMITITLDKVTLRDALAAIAKAGNLSLSFDDGLPGLDRRVSFQFDHVTAASAVLRALDGTTLRAMVSPSGQVVLVRREGSATARRLTIGVVREADSSAAAIPGARVDVVGTRFTALSREDGGFTLGELPPGEYTVRATRLGFRPATLERVRVDSGAPIEVVMSRAPIPLAAMVVTPGYFGMMATTMVAPRVMTRQQIETIPQLGEDIFRAVNRLPGVSTDDFSAKFGVRGASGDELYVSLDGLELVEPFHLKDLQGGALSILDSRAIGGVELTTGSYTAEYGDRLTGVFTMKSVDPKTDGTWTSLGLSLMNARATTQGGFANGRGGWLASARRGYIDVALKVAEASDSLKPRFYDLFGKVHYDLGRAGRVAAHALYAGDDLRYLENPEDNFRSRYRSSYGWLTWDGQVGSRLQFKTVGSIANLTWRRDSEVRQRGQLDALVSDRRTYTVGVLRQDWMLDAGPRALLKWGVEAKADEADYAYHGRQRILTLDANKRIVAHYVTRDVELAPNGSRFGAYLAPRFRPIEPVTIEAGLRFDRASHTSDDIVSPRFNASWQIADGTTVRGAWGRYSQSQPLFALQAQDGIDTFFPAERAEHRGVSVEQRLPARIRARAEVYERKLTNPRPMFVNTASSLDMVPELSPDRVRIDPTSGRARGLELYLVQEGGRRMDWSTSYALASIADRVGGRMVPRANDQRHTLYGDWSFRPVSNKWRFTVAGVWHTGWPYTTQVLTVDTILDTPQQIGVFTRSRPGTLYTERLSSYRRVDVRWTRYFDTRSGRVAFFADVFNLFNNFNLRGFETNVNTFGRSVTVWQSNEQFIPRLPTVGINWEFGSSRRR